MTDRRARTKAAMQALSPGEATGLGAAVLQGAITIGVMVGSILRAPDAFLVVSEVVLAVATLILALALLHRAGIRLAGVLIGLELVLMIVLLVRLGVMWSDDRTSSGSRVIATAFDGAITLMGFAVLQGLAQARAARRRGMGARGAADRPGASPPPLPLRPPVGGYPPPPAGVGPIPTAPVAAPDLPWSWRRGGATVGSFAVVAIVMVAAVGSTAVRNDPERTFRREANFDCQSPHTKLVETADRRQYRADIERAEAEIAKLEHRLEQLDPPTDDRPGWSGVLRALRQARREYETAVDDFINDRPSDVHADLLLVLSDLHQLSAYGDRHSLRRCARAFP